MTAIRQCDYCKGNHTEVKCPRLDGYIKHLNAVVHTKSSATRELVDEDYSKYGNHGMIWNLFWRTASVQEKLNLSPWTWQHIIGSYGKKLRYREAGLKRRGIKRKKIVTCGYCKGKGHTRRTCESMNSDITIADDMAKVQRAMFLNTCKSIGMGVGALLRFEWSLETKKYASYHAGLPTSLMGVVTSIPVSDINPFIDLARWDTLSHDAYFGMSLINPTGPFKESATKLHVTSGILSGAFDGLCINSKGARHLGRHYDSIIVAPSSNFDYCTDTEDDYKKNTFKKYGASTLEQHISRMQTWLKEQS